MKVKELKVKRIGYKGFNVKEDGTLYCRDMTFKIGDMAEVKGPLVICKNGIHFCWNLNDVNDYYNLRDSVICEVEPLGEIVADIDGKKCCTNKLKVSRMLPKEEVLKISNTGNENTGYINSGNWNSGNWNSGDWNSGNWNAGFFNENENKCYIFDHLSDMTASQFRSSCFYDALISVPFVLTEWIEYTKEEKEEDKAKELIGGYLKKYEYKEACKKWWDKLSDKNKEIIQEIPNFDAEKFYRITGIRV